MNSQLLAIALLLKAVKADFDSDASAASSAASVLSGSVAAWSSGDGLQGALGIQGYFPTLSSAVAALSGDVGSLTDSEVDTSTVQGFGSAVIGLLNALTEKASAFSSVGVGSIVSNDISGITGPSGAIVSGIVSAIESDCDKLGSLTPVLDSLEAAFSSAASAYSVSAPSFPTAPSCAASGGSNAASSDPSAASSGGAESATSAAASSAASSAETSAASSAASSAATSAASSAAESSVAVASTSASAPAIANSANKAAVAGLSGIAVGAVAMLL